MIKVLLPILIVVAIFIIPDFHFSFDTGVILTVISILFTILAGFFIAAATSNYLRLQTLITDVNAGMMSMFELVGIINPERVEDVGQVIDDYMISSLDRDLLDFALHTEVELNKVSSVINSVTPKNDIGTSLMQNLHSEKTRMYSNHQEMTVATKRIVGPRHWTILILLSLLIDFMVLTFRDESIISYIVVAALILANYQISVLLNDIDNNLFLAKKLAFQSPQQVFRKIGRLPYYPKFAANDPTVNITEKKYRIGSEVPNSRDKKIEIVEIK